MCSGRAAAPRSGRATQDTICLQPVHFLADQVIAFQNVSPFIIGLARFFFLMTN